MIERTASGNLLQTNSNQSANRTASESILLRLRGSVGEFARLSGYTLLSMVSPNISTMWAAVNPIKDQKPITADGLLTWMESSQGLQPTPTIESL